MPETHLSTLEGTFLHRSTQLNGGERGFSREQSERRYPRPRRDRFWQPGRFEARRGKHGLAPLGAETLSGPSGGVGVHDVRRLCRRTSLSVAVSVASLS